MNRGLCCLAALVGLGVPVSAGVDLITTNGQFQPGAAGSNSTIYSTGQPKHIRHGRLGRDCGECGLDRKLLDRTGRR
jgi:hypothetical protein